MGLSLLTCIEITNCYPEEVLVEAERYDNGKWLGVLYRIKDGVVHKTLISQNATEDFHGYETKEEAIQKMEDLILEIAVAVEEHMKKD